MYLKMTDKNKEKKPKKFGGLKRRKKKFGILDDKPEKENLDRNID